MRQLLKNSVIDTNKMVMIYGGTAFSIASEVICPPAIAETEKIEPYIIVKKNKIFLIKNSQKFQSNNLIQL